MIFATGDTHGRFLRFDPECFPKQKNMTRNDKKLDWLNGLPFTILFVDGNHEKFDALNTLPVEGWQGGKIHRVRPNILHLTHGQVIDLDGHTFLTMGGASSHDIEGGILDAGTRVSLEHVGWGVDYVITHCAPMSIANTIGGGEYVSDRRTDFLEEVNCKLKFHYLLFGHYHDNRNIDKHHILLWEQIVRIIITEC